MHINIPNNLSQLLFSTFCTYSSSQLFFSVSFFFFNDTATTEIYTLSLHDALPISGCTAAPDAAWVTQQARQFSWRSEEHTSELQSRVDLVCRLLLEKKKKNAR